MNDRAILLKHWQAEAERLFSGWDFSYIAGRYNEDVPPWSYTDIVRTALHDADSLLDMGTGGGEFLLSLGDAVPADTVATEGYAPNMPVAEKNLSARGITVKAYDSEKDARMPFPDGRFKLIISRHESYKVDEIKRVLSAGGQFITQQVDGRDLQDLYSQFGVSGNYPHVTLEHFKQDLQSVGLEVTQALDWQGNATFQDVGALVYFLHAVPWVAPDDFSVERYQDVLFRLHEQAPLSFTIRRFLLQAVKAA